jgi:fluoroquinolone transport system permease protein
VVAALWVVLLRLLPPTPRAVAAPLVVFGDLAVVGYFFVGGMVLFEKAEGTLSALSVSPLRPGHYLAGRVVGGGVSWSAVQKRHHTHVVCPAA